jgi:hypothetical protein
MHDVPDNRFPVKVGRLAQVPVAPSAFETQSIQVACQRGRMNSPALSLVISQFLGRPLEPIPKSQA